MMEDRHLPSLTRAIDPVSMSAGFEEFFRREYPDRGLRVTRCEVCQVHHKPGRSCRVIYRLRGRDEQDRSFDQWPNRGC